MNINENLIELVDIDNIIHTDEYINMVDIAVEDDESFLLSNGLISHNSAAGSVKQARDSETEGVYALKGKIKNTRKLSDLSNNVEILEIMGVLDILPDSDKQPVFDRIVIAADEDCIDENHLILTDSGDKKIKNLTYNDKVLTHTGQYKSIEKIVESIKEYKIEIELEGKIFTCSDYHKLIIMRDGEIIEIYAKDLKLTDFILQKR
jgi:hypothetical protein